ncbi:hypothetical protein COHA_003747 [Chlorella ohadii]|uniref:Uncharacterized protein n=1 Tax=Chlorella ohadii TaxID=2649997 RepID=A0AAD5H6H1_9CHLO|nr:hypothetical protein COHA_003747 [Chlorella ohadii]
MLAAGQADGIGRLMRAWRWAVDHPQQALGRLAQLHPNIVCERVRSRQPALPLALPALTLPPPASGGLHSIVAFLLASGDQAEASRRAGLLQQQLDAANRFHLTDADLPDAAFAPAAADRGHCQAAITSTDRLLFPGECHPTVQLPGFGQQPFDLTAAAVVLAVLDGQHSYPESLLLLGQPEDGDGSSGEGGSEGESEDDEGYSRGGGRAAVQLQCQYQIVSVCGNAWCIRHARIGHMHMKTAQLTICHQLAKGNVQHFVPPAYQQAAAVARHCRHNNRQYISSEPLLHYLTDGPHPGPCFTLFYNEQTVAERAHANGLATMATH